MGKKVLELEALNAKKDNHIASLEAELKRAKEEYEAETNRIREASAEAAVNLSGAQVKIEDLNDEIEHLRQWKENYRILMSSCYTLGNRCRSELEKTFSSAGATSREKNYTEGDLEGMMRWIVSEIRAYKGVLSTREDYYVWIGARNTASVLLKAGCHHIKACTKPDFEVSVDSVRRSTIEASEWSKKILSDIWNKGGKEISTEESLKNKEKIRKAAEKTGSIRKDLQQKKAEGNN